MENLTNDINHVIDNVLLNKPVNNYFKNKTGFYDGNMYGIVLHTAGVVIHDFLSERPSSSIGNEEILLNNISISNITSEPIEVLGVESSEGKIQVGAFGDVFDVSLSSVNKDGKCIYRGNSLSNAQLFLEKYEKITNSDNISKLESNIINWAETGEDLLKIMDDNNLLMIPNKDSMAHTMKGNIGLFISGGKDLVFNNIQIEKVHTKGTYQKQNESIDEVKIKTPRTFQGANVSGILITASSNLEFNKIKIDDIESDVQNSSICYTHIRSGDNIIGIKDECIMEIENEEKKMIL